MKIKDIIEKFYLIQDGFQKKWNKIGKHGEQIRKLKANE